MGQLGPEGYFERSDIRSQILTLRPDLVRSRLPSQSRSRKPSPGTGQEHRCLRNKRPSNPYAFIGFGAMDVTKFVCFGDLHNPKPYRFIGSRWAFISQTPVVLPRNRGGTTDNRPEPSGVCPRREIFPSYTAPSQKPCGHIGCWPGLCRTQKEHHGLDDLPSVGGPGYARQITLICCGSGRGGC